MMYGWLCSRFPRVLVDALYGIWYAVLMVLILLMADYVMADFYYLHG